MSDNLRNKIANFIILYECISKLQIDNHKNLPIYNDEHFK